MAPCLENTLLTQKTLTLRYAGYRKLNAEQDRSLGNRSSNGRGANMIVLIWVLIPVGEMPVDTEHSDSIRTLHGLYYRSYTGNRMLTQTT